MKPGARNRLSNGHLVRHRRRARARKGYCLLCSSSGDTRSALRYLIKPAETTSVSRLEQRYPKTHVGLFSSSRSTALERTYLAYLRTSLALSFLAAIIAQLFRLQRSSQPDLELGYFVLGKPLACMCVVAAIIVSILGTWRFWRQQNAMLRGKVWAGGWEMNGVGAVIFAVSFWEWHWDW